VVRVYWWNALTNYGCYSTYVSKEAFVLDVRVDPDELLLPLKIQLAQAWGYRLAKLKEIFIEGELH